jgi:hypothetical protein
MERDPSIDPFGLRDINERSKCTDNNIKIEYELALNRLSYDESLKVVKSIAQRIASQAVERKDAGKKSGPCQRTDRGLICREESDYSLTR